MNKWRGFLLIACLLTVLLIPAMAANNPTPPPEEIDRQKKAKAKVERERQKAKAAAPTPSASPSKKEPIKSVIENKIEYKDETGPAYEEIAPEPGVYIIESVPSGADVYMKGKHLGKTPLTIADMPGSYPLLLKYPGYEELSVGIIIMSGRNRRILVHMDQL